MPGQNTTVMPQILIPQILDAYEQTGTNVSLTPDDRQQLTTVLETTAKFAVTVGMYDVLKRYNLRILFMLHHSPSLMEWLGPTSRYSPYIQSALMLVMLIEAIANDDPTQQRLDTLEAIVQKYVSRDRTLPTALIFMANVLNALHDDDVAVNFQPSQFDIDEPLIPETALLSTLATFRILQTVIPKQPTAVDSTKNIFKLFYGYYVDLQATLNYTDFLNQQIQFLSANAADARLTKFYFGLYTRLCEQVKALPLFEPQSFYTVYNMHPLTLIDNLPDKICTFCQTLQDKNTDYATNLDQYVKDYRDIISYAWNEINEAYLLAQHYDPDTVIDVKQIKILANDILDAVCGCYFDSRTIPHKSILAFFRPGQAMTGVGAGMMDKFLDQAFGFAQQFAAQMKNPMLDMINNPSTQNMIRMGARNLNFGKVLDNGFVKKYVSLNFDFIAKGLLYFWRIFAKSTDFKNLATAGDSSAILKKFLDTIHDPAMNYVRTWLDKTPYGAMVSLPSVGKIVDIFLGQARNALTRSGAGGSPIFTTGTQVVNDFARSVSVS
jgi:hypothetical protein